MEIMKCKFVELIDTFLVEGASKTNSSVSTASKVEEMRRTFLAFVRQSSRDGHAI